VEQCIGCEHLAKRHEELHATVQKQGEQLDKHDHKLSAIDNVNTNTNSSIESIRKDIASLNKLYEQQVAWQTAHEKAEIAKMEEIKSTMSAGHKEILEVLAPIKKETDKNSKFIMKSIYAFSGASGLAYGAYWLHSKGLVIVAIPGGAGG